MMHFFHQFLLYVTFEVLEPLWHTMSIQCHSAKTLDQVMPTSLQLLLLLRIETLSVSSSTLCADVLHI